MKYCNTGIINCKDCWDWDKDRCKVGLHNPNDKVAIAIAARDKWWIERLNEEHVVLRLTDNQMEFEPGDYIAMPLSRWQSLKKEIGL
jgi:hypothetical protein